MTSSTTTSPEPGIDTGSPPDLVGGASGKGILYGVAAFASWGLFPLYFRAIHDVNPIEVLAHRVIWSAVFLVGLMMASRQLSKLRALLRDFKRLRLLLASTVLVAANWLIFIWAVSNHHVLDASLGYFINPLVNVLLATLFLRERLRPLQWLGILVTASGVFYQAMGLHHWPVIALSLAFTFSLYGIVRKVVHVEPVAGLAIETILLMPFALAYLVASEYSGHASFLNGDARTSFLLLSAGVITAVPLIWFVHATRLLRYSTVGVIQYIAPTGQFLLAVLAFGEPFTRRHFVSFSFVWCGIAIYLWNARRAATAPEPA